MIGRGVRRALGDFYWHVFTADELETEATRAGFSRASTDVDDAYVLRPRV